MPASGNRNRDSAGVADPSCWNHTTTRYRHICPLNTGAVPSLWRIRGHKTPTWFALDAHRPLVAFAGLWTPSRGARGPKSARIEGQYELSGFLTTEANAAVAPIHPKAMPVILTTPAEVDLWLTADAPKALELQRPLPDDALRIVASGEKEDCATSFAAFSWNVIERPTLALKSRLPSRYFPEAGRAPELPLGAMRDHQISESSG
jgi:SOS response associated peptidase (SRAP)